MHLGSLYSPPTPPPLLPPPPPPPPPPSATPPPPLSLSLSLAASRPSCHNPHLAVEMRTSSACALMNYLWFGLKLVPDWGCLRNERLVFVEHRRIWPFLIRGGGGGGGGGVGWNGEVGVGVGEVDLSAIDRQRVNRYSIQFVTVNSTRSRRPPFNRFQVCPFPRKDIESSYSPRLLRWAKSDLPLEKVTCRRYLNLVGCLPGSEETTGTANQNEQWASLSRDPLPQSGLCACTFPLYINHVTIPQQL